MRYLVLLFCLSAACALPSGLELPRQPVSGLTGKAFYDSIVAASREQREALAVKEILSGDFPGFLRKMVRIHTDLPDTNGHKRSADFWVMPDYLSVGTNDNWARIPLTPMAAQQIADSFHCFLPTRRMVDLIYQQARVKLEPVPMYAFRDSAITFWQHHLIIEGQRRGRRGLIAGIKKDVVITGRLSRSHTPDRVAIYGWHRLDGRPIQLLYTGHVNWYVDYSHGIRLVYELVRVNGRWMHYSDVLKNPEWRALLCDEEDCDFLKYQIK